MKPELKKDEENVDELETARQLAAWVLVELRLDAPTDVAGIAAIMGIEIRRVATLVGLPGFLWPGLLWPVIVINQYMSPERQRFTIAHELGHYWMDREARPVWPHAASVSSPIEVRANAFAADLLMPADAVRACLERGLTVDAMAHHFRTSQAAMRRQVLRLSR